MVKIACPDTPHAPCPKCGMREAMVDVLRETKSGLIDWDRERAGFFVDAWLEQILKKELEKELLLAGMEAFAAGFLARSHHKLIIEAYCEWRESCKSKGG